MTQINPPPPQDPLLGCLLGTAVGDSIGLPTEGMSKRRSARLVTNGLRHRFVLGRGMLSDDTEHTLMLMAALRRYPDNLEAMQRDFGRQLRWWLAALPAGVGLSTARAIGKLWLGYPASRSGVYSAGNGAAMRSAIIGAMFAHDDVKRRNCALAACRVTHTDPRAEESALLVAEATALAAKAADTREVLDALRPILTSEIMEAHSEALETGLNQK